MAKGTVMRDRHWFGAVVLALAGAATNAWALDFDAAKYPDIRGAWARPGAAQWDPTKPPGLRQQAPLVAEFQAVFEANLADAAAGGQGYNPQVICLPSGMPRAGRGTAPPGDCCAGDSPATVPPQAVMTPFLVFSIVRLLRLPRMR